jgi:hypothetical protein
MYGVQAYNISANEYEVIVKFAKQGGRYYFIDRDGNRYLASRYDRAEDVAAGILENIECTELTVNALVDEMQANGKVAVISEVLDLFFEECDSREIEAESVENHYHDDGEMYTVYRIKNAQNDAQSNETAADEQQGENEATATTCKLSAFSGILAKVKDSARKVCEKVAFAMSVIFIVAVALLALYFSVLGIGEGLDMLGIDGMARVVCALFLLLTVWVEIAVNVEINIIAVFDRLFPPLFNNQKPAPFIVPFTFWYRIIKDMRK